MSARLSMAKVRIYSDNTMTLSALFSGQTGRRRQNRHSARKENALGTDENGVSANESAFRSQKVRTASNDGAIRN